MNRPRPPADAAPFVPAPEVWDWVQSAFLADDAPLRNFDHDHLRFATIGILWTWTPNERQGRTVLGQAEHKPPGGSMGKWARARAETQFASWFGTPSLDFLITLSAPFCAICTDGQFCALVEHELYHCGQAKDEFGQPKFSRMSGLPVYAMRGHDIEQFTAVVARYGADAAGVREMIEAAQTGPVIDDGALAMCCGTCG